MHNTLIDRGKKGKNLNAAMPLINETVNLIISPDLISGKSFLYTPGGRPESCAAWVSTKGKKRIIYITLNALPVQ